MKQDLVYVEAYHYSDLCLQVQRKIDEYSLEKYYLADIKYFKMERNDVKSHAFLLFNECKESL